jgi:alpha-beta hydrolase superfamily lysophospholipase
MVAVASLVAVLPPMAAAPAGDSGPPLLTDPVALDTAWSCPDGLTHPGRPVVLLVHGTATTAEESWTGGLGHVLPAAGFDWCMVQLPGRSLVDIQVSSEYVVAAVRAIHRRTGGQVSLVGHSQGALQIRWAVRWWPDVRAVVDDLFSLAGANRPIPWFGVGRRRPASVAHVATAHRQKKLPRQLVSQPS